MPVAAELEALRREVREFLSETLGVREEVPCDCWQRSYSRSFSEAVGARGWLGMTLPPEYGGAGRSALERFVVAEELLVAGAPVAAHWITERQVAPSILRHGTEEQRQRFLPGILRGEVVFAIGMSEPDSGSDLASIKSRARPEPGGGYRLSGQKTWSSLAHEADFVLVLCRTGEGGGRHDGISQLIVDASLPGVEIRRIPSMGGDDHFCEIFFDDVLVPAEGLLGVEGEGWKQVNEELAFERGGPERYLSAWPLFGAFARRASGDELAVQATGEVAAQLVAVRQLAGDIATAMDGGGDFRVAAALEKDAGTSLERGMIETVGRVAAEVALTDEEFGRVLADATNAAPAFTLRGGTTEIMRTIVARELEREPEMSATSEQAMVAEMVADVLAADERAAAARREVPGAGEELWRQLEELGLTLAGVPEESGGAGGSAAEALTILRVAGAHALVLPLLETQLGAWLLAEAGLPIPSGPLALAPAGFGDRVVARGPIASAVLEGVSHGTPGFAGATRVVVAVAGEDDAPAAAGVAPEELAATPLRNAAGTRRDLLRFREAAAEARPVGERAAPEQVLRRAALGRCAMIVGALHAVKDQSVAFASERQQFGRPILKFQAVAHQLAIVARESAMAEAATRAAGEHLVAGECLPLVEVAAAKVVCAKAATTVAAVAHQLHGAIGVTSEQPLARFTAQLLAWRDDFGGERAWAAALGRELVGAEDPWLRLSATGHFQPVPSKVIRR